MSYEVSVVLPEHIDFVFPHIVEYMERLEKRFHGVETVASIMKDIESGKNSLWIVYDKDSGRIVAFYTLQIYQTEYRRVLGVPHVGGVEMQDWIGLVMETVKSFAKDQGCPWVETYGRPGWAQFYKKYGGRKTRETYEFKIEDLNHGR
jgi:hypothetical protein